jgi:chemotaxis protein CheX
MFSIAIDNGVCRLSLNPVLGMREAQPLKDALQEALSKGLPLILDAHSIERLSTACAQILLAFAAAMEQAGLPFRLSRPSATFLAAFSALGLDPIIRTWTVEE